MKLAKWGNSLAVRIPADVVEKLKLTPGEEIQVHVTGEGKFEVRRDRRRQEALERIRKMNITLPEGYVFRRSDIYDE